MTNMYTVPINATVTVTLTGKELARLHDTLTTIYNNYYDEIHPSDE